MLHAHHVEIQKGQERLFPCRSERPGRTDIPALRLNRVCNGVCSQCGIPYVAEHLDHISPGLAKALTQLVAYVRYVPKLPF
jgi:hypothetical protein